MKGWVVKFKGVALPEENHVIWLDSKLEIGDEVEVELTEFEEASEPIMVESDKNFLKKIEAALAGGTEMWEHKLEECRRLEKIYK